MSTESRILIGYWNDHENNYPQYPMPVGESVLDINMYKFHEMVADYLDSGDIVNQYVSFDTVWADILKKALS